jgi:hypothetical protein
MYCRRGISAAALSFQVTHINTLIYLHAQTSFTCKGKRQATVRWLPDICAEYAWGFGTMNERRLNTLDLGPQSAHHWRIQSQTGKTQTPWLSSEKKHKTVNWDAHLSKKSLVLPNFPDRSKIAPRCRVWSLEKNSNSLKVPARFDGLSSTRTRLQKHALTNMWCFEHAYFNTSRRLAFDQAALSPLGASKRSSTIKRVASKKLYRRIPNAQLHRMHCRCSINPHVLQRGSHSNSRRIANAWLGQVARRRHTTQRCATRLNVGLYPLNYEDIISYTHIPMPICTLHDFFHPHTRRGRSHDARGHEHLLSHVARQRLHRYDCATTGLSGSGTAAMSSHDSRYFSSHKKGNCGQASLRSEKYWSDSSPSGEIAEWRQDLKRNDRDLLKTTVKRSTII